MSFADLCRGAYQWLDGPAVELMLAAVALPVAGTLAALLGRALRKNADGRVIASLVIGASACVFALLVASIILARVAFDAAVLDANALLLSAPIVCLVGSLYGIHWVYPLNQLASVRTMGDIALFCLACAALLWFVSQFRGWGILFHGGLLELAALAVLTYFLLRRLYRRAFARR